MKEPELILKNVQEFYELTNPFHGLTIAEYNKCKDFLTEKISIAYRMGYHNAQEKSRTDL